MALVLAAGSCSPTGVSACPCNEIQKPTAEKPKDDQMMKAGLAFTHTAAYTREFAKAIQDGKAACLKHKGEPNVAIVSDLDETLLDNRPNYQQHPDAFDEKSFDQWMKKGEAPLLRPTQEFLAWARNNGYAVFFVTGRYEKDRAPTTENLIRRKVSYDGLYMRHDGDDRPAEEMKTEWRSQIEKAGFKVIVSIGDQFSDLYGGHDVDCEKLPNKMYYIP